MRNHSVSGQVPETFNPFENLVFRAQSQRGKIPDYQISRRCRFRQHRRTNSQIQIQVPPNAPRDETGVAACTHNITTAHVFMLVSRFPQKALLEASLKMISSRTFDMFSLSLWTLPTFGAERIFNPEILNFCLCLIPAL